MCKCNEADKIEDTMISFHVMSCLLPSAQIVAELVTRKKRREHKVRHMYIISRNDPTL
jgi:hypothetical protein